MKFIIDGALVQAIAEYLASQPFREVRRMIEALEQVQPVEMPEAVEPDNATDDSRTKAER